MQAFSYHNPTQIHFGDGGIARLADSVPADARVLLTYGGGSIVHNGVYAEVKAALGARACLDFAGIEPNPSLETLSRAVALLRRQPVDWIVAVGGGSVIDGSKFIAAAACHAGAPAELLQPRFHVKQALPLGVVLTLPATGSESNPYAVISQRATQDKRTLASPWLQPRFAVLDPTATRSLPARQIGNGVVDAFVHVLEQYLTYPTGARVQDRFAEGLLQTLIEVGPDCLAEPADLTARGNLMWAANQALNGLIGAGVPQDWTCHAIGHQLTALYGLDHAQSLAAVLPALLQQRRTAKFDKLLQYARRVWRLDGGDPEQAVDTALALTRGFIEEMGLGTSLGDYGLDATVAAPVLDKLQAQRRTRLGERGDVTLDDVRQILLAAQ